MLLAIVTLVAVVTLVTVMMLVAVVTFVAVRTLVAVVTFVTVMTLVECCCANDLKQISLCGLYRAIVPCGWSHANVCVDLST